MMNKKTLLLGNEAIAGAIVAAGCQVATAYPDQKFLIYDDTTHVGENANVVNVSYKQNDMGYLIGVFAAAMTAETSVKNINADKVVFKRVPVAFRDNMAPQQRMYYALDAMGKIEQVHAQAFAAVQDERKPLASDREIIEFVAKQGIDANRFKALYDSFSVQSQARNAMNQQTAYRIDSVPTIAIDGRYITSVSHATKRPGVAQTEAGLQAATLQIMDELVARTLKERAAGK